MAKPIPNNTKTKGGKVRMVGKIYGKNATRNKKTNEPANHTRRTAEKSLWIGLDLILAYALTT